MNFVVNVRKLRIVSGNSLKIGDELSWNGAQIRKPCLINLVKHNDDFIVPFESEFFVKQQWG